MLHGRTPTLNRQVEQLERIGIFNALFSPRNRAPPARVSARQATAAAASRAGPQAQAAPRPAFTMAYRCQRICAASNGTAASG
jgi:hypothetical protein